MSPRFNTSLWKRLREHAQSLQCRSLPDLLQNKHERAHTYLINAAGIHLDYSKNFLTDKTLQLFAELLQENNASEKINSLFAGEYMNRSEEQQVFHTLTRLPEPLLAKKNPTLFASQQAMLKTAADIRAGLWRSQNLPPLRHIIHLGIGGADSGARFVYEAFAASLIPQFNVYFIDAYHSPALLQLFNTLDPAVTLVIVSSKSFKTSETLANWQLTREWLGQRDLNQHVIAITANPTVAASHAIPSQNILTFPKEIGGRYSIWSAVGLPLAAAFGPDFFTEFLTGASLMDEHFQNAPLRENMPQLSALLSIWYRQCFAAHSQCVVSYHPQFSYFTPYIQQLYMESNGKNCTEQGNEIDYPTAGVVWGGLGSATQHSFFQLLHQGTNFIPVTFLVFQSANFAEQNFYIDNCLAQSRVLMVGDNNAITARRLSGSRPSNTFVLSALTPRTIGALMALFEHQVFMESVLLNLNPFDQWGVEKGKIVAANLPSLADLDPSTLQLLNLCYGSKENR